MNVARKLSLALVGLLVPWALSACSTPRVRASAAMVQSNPIQRIAVFGEAQVVWPRTGWNASAKAPYFGVCESRQGLEHQLPLVRQALEAKGYEVLACEPAGVGYFAPWLTERLVLEAVMENGVEQDNPDRHTVIADSAPLHQYAAIASNPEHSAALRRVFEGLEAAVAARTADKYAPSAEDAAAIAEATGADTICLVRVGGSVYSSGRKVGTMLLAAAVGGGGGVRDVATLDCWLLDARTGETLWVAGRADVERPNQTDADFVGRTLELLPERGKNLDPKNRLDP